MQKGSDNTLTEYHKIINKYFFFLILDQKINNISSQSSSHFHVLLVPCFLRAAYTTALQPFAMGGPRTKLLSPTRSSSFVTSVLLCSVFKMFHCIRDTASCRHYMTLTATFKFNNNSEQMGTYILNCVLCNFVCLTDLNALLHTVHAGYNTLD